MNETNYKDLFIYEGFCLLLLDWLLFKLLISSIVKYILLPLLGVILVVRHIWSYSNANLRLISNKFIFYFLFFLKKGNNWYAPGALGIAVTSTVIAFCLLFVCTTEHSSDDREVELQQWAFSMLFTVMLVACMKNLRFQANLYIFINCRLRDNTILRL